MEPIISPWTIYWIDRLDAIKIFIVWAIGFCLIAAFANFVTSDSAYPECKGPERRVLAKKFFVAAILFAVLIVLIPDKITVYKMLVAQQITPQNIELTGEKLEKGLDIISDKVIKILESGKIQ